MRSGVELRDGTGAWEAPRLRGRANFSDSGKVVDHLKSRSRAFRLLRPAAQVCRRTPASQGPSRVPIPAGSRVGGGLLAPAAAQPTGAVPQPAPVDRLTLLEQRQEALERENAALRLLLAPMNPPPAGPAAVAAPVPCPPDGAAAPMNFIERLGTYYNRGFVLMESSDPERVPFKLVVGNFAQVRYTNTQLDSLTFVDHLGVVRPVDPRNDISFNRDLLTFSGYAFDPKLQYYLIVWSSGSLASVVVAGGSATSSARRSF